MQARLLSIKDKITNGAIVTAGTIAALDEVIASVEAMKAEANTALGVSATISAQIP